MLGKEIIYLDEVDSTQDYIKNKKDAKEGLVVVAGNQLNGRGTKGRSWKSAPNKNLTFSFLLEPNCKLEKFNNLTLLIAQTIVKTIEGLYGYKLQIKYPNDVMLHGKKICGILAESNTRGEIVEKLIIGVGFNVNQTEFDEEIQGIATSLKKEFGREFDKEKILLEFLRLFEEEYNKK